MRIAKPLLVFVALSTGAVGATSDSPMISKAKGAVLKQLIEPTSAQFSELKLRKGSSGNEAVCGMVNARNGMGGMTGPQPFVYDGKSANVLVLAAGAKNPTTFSPDVLALIFRRGSDNYSAFCN